MGERGKEESTIRVLGRGKGHVKSQGRFWGRGPGGCWVARKNIELTYLLLSSASPLNGEAAELWDKDPAEFKRKVLARHVELDDDEDEDEDEE